MFHSSDSSIAYHDNFRFILIKQLNSLELLALAMGDHKADFAFFEKISLRQANPHMKPQVKY